MYDCAQCVMHWKFWRECVDPICAMFHTWEAGVWPWCPHTHNVVWSWSANKRKAWCISNFELTVMYAYAQCVFCLVVCLVACYACACAFRAACLYSFLLVYALFIFVWPWRSLEIRFYQRVCFKVFVLLLWLCLFNVGIIIYICFWLCICIASDFDSCQVSGFSILRLLLAILMLFWCLFFLSCCMYLFFFRVQIFVSLFCRVAHACIVS